MILEFRSVEDAADVAEWSTWALNAVPRTLSFLPNKLPSVRGQERFDVKDKAAPGDFYNSAIDGQFRMISGARERENPLAALARVMHYALQSSA